MFVKRNTCLLVFLLCSLTLWCKSTSAGSSFLSPSQKPQNKGKPPRVGRQVMEEPIQPAVDNHLTIRPLFDIGFTVREEDFKAVRCSSADHSAPSGKHGGSNREPITTLKFMEKNVNVAVSMPFHLLFNQ